MQGRYGWEGGRERKANKTTEPHYFHAVFYSFSFPLSSVCLLICYGCSFTVGTVHSIFSAAIERKGIVQCQQWRFQCVINLFVSIHVGIFSNKYRSVKRALDLNFPSWCVALLCVRTNAIKYLLQTHHPLWWLVLALSTQTYQPPYIGNNANDNEENKTESDKTIAFRSAFTP